MDLSNYLLIRTRERIIMESHAANPATLLKNGKISKSKQDIIRDNLQEIRFDINKHLEQLNRILNISKGDEDLPVAFATNALYVLERNGAGDHEQYSRILLPVLKKKIEYLHAEGVAHAVWALSNAGIWDTEVWEGLAK